MTRDRLLELAREAGFGMQYVLQYNEWTQYIWGGESETRKVEKLADLIIQEVQCETRN